MRSDVIAILAACVALLGSGHARSEPAPSVTGAGVTLPGSRPTTTPEYTLDRCLSLAERNYPKVHEARSKLDRMRAQLREAKTAPYSQFNLDGGMIVAPTVRGTNIYSPNTDDALTSNMSLAWRVGIEGVVPLWTFGKISNLRDAAEAQTRVGQHDIKKEQNEVKLSVREAFYGAQLARDARALVQSAIRRIDKHLGSLEKKVDEGDGDDIELLKLKMYRAELVARQVQAGTQERVALAALRFLVGVDRKKAFDIPDEPLERVSHTLGPLAHYLTAARLYRPEVNMARAGVVARRAQMRLERSKYFPDLGLALRAQWAQAPEITDQVNPFVRDPANFVRYGAGLVLRWKLDFLPQAARVAQARANLEQMRATERFALGGVAVEVERAFHEARGAKRRLEAFTEATQYAKRWLIKVQQGIDIGTFDDEDIVDPAKEYALKKFARMSAVFDYNMALAKLALATGWDSVASAAPRG